ncbi:MAG: chromate efflux transporter, partial [Cytophagaceae bacterium]|nr:chromate efflux transporter [Gemmatimonadaceae bacterium]
GPIALVGYMQRDLVEQRGWFSEADYREGLALAQLAPGPLAAQLAFYLGWVRAGVAGATVVGLAFVLPSFLMVLALSVAYLRFGGLAWMQGAFYGIGAAVIAIIVRSVVKLSKLTLARDALLWGVFAVNALVVAWTESEILWVFVASGVLLLVLRGGWLGGRGAGVGQTLGMLAMPAALPAWLTTGLHGPAGSDVLWQILWFFFKGGAVVFGSGLAIVPFLYGGVVEGFGWLTERQFIDAVAVSMITPGPVVITVAFIGYLTAGPLGAIIAALGVFLPVYLITIVAAPYFKRVVGNRSVKAFVQGVTAAATGAIAGAAFVLGRRAVIDLPTLAIGLVTLALLLCFRKIPEPAVIAVAGIAGILLRLDAGGLRG